MRKQFTVAEEGGGGGERERQREQQEREVRIWNLRIVSPTLKSHKKKEGKTFSLSHTHTLYSIIPSFVFTPLPHQFHSSLTTFLFFFLTFHNNMTTFSVSFHQTPPLHSLSTS
ncbi:hypothetical protein S245_035032 [Arachis hypogaea]